MTPASVSRSAGEPRGPRRGCCPWSAPPPASGGRAPAAAACSVSRAPPGASTPQLLPLPGTSAVPKMPRRHGQQAAMPARARPSSWHHQRWAAEDGGRPGVHAGRSPRRALRASDSDPQLVKPRRVFVLTLLCHRISISTMSLDVPVTAMDTKKGENRRLAYAVSAMQGYRENMEDAHKVDLNLDPRTATSFFGVYDGHGGPAVSKYCAKHLHIELRKDAGFRNDPVAAIQRTFLRMDTMMASRKAGKELCEYGAGSEYWDNCKKEIRAARFTFCGQAIVLSTDFKPSLPGERERIENTGRTVYVPAGRGNIERIDGEIAISRAIGDLAYKNVEGLSAEQQAITAYPEVRTEAITHDDQFLIIACDGIWDCLSSQQAVTFVNMYLNSNVGLSVICEALLQHCVSVPSGRDNMTVMLVRFKNPPPAGPAA
nr:unnamed protein product [Digitaria exilis]